MTLRPVWKLSVSCDWGFGSCCGGGGGEEEGGVKREVWLQV